MNKKKVLIHGNATSLKKFFSSPLTRKKYDCLAILSDDKKVKTVSESPQGGGV